MICECIRFIAWTVAACVRIRIRFLVLFNSTKCGFDCCNSVWCKVNRKNSYNTMVDSVNHLRSMPNESEEYNYNPMVGSATQLRLMLNKSEENNYNPMVGFDKIRKSVPMCSSCAIKQDTEIHFCGQWVVPKIRFWPDWKKCPEQVSESLSESWIPETIPTSRHYGIAGFQGALSFPGTGIAGFKGAFNFPGTMVLRDLRGPSIFPALWYCGV